jgi:uncharacterized membrane protein
MFASLEKEKPDTENIKYLNLAARNQQVDLGVFFDPEDGGDMFLQNVGSL